MLRPHWSSSVLLFLIVVAAPAAADHVRWTPIGPEGVDVVYSLAIDPRTPSTLYAGTSSAGIFKSTDGGATWQPKSRGLEGYPIVHHLLVDPQNPSTLYTSLANSKSTDGGETWFRNAPLVGSVGPSAIDPKNPSTIYAVETYFGAFKSSDGGASWQQIATDIGIVASVVVDPHGSDVLYAFIEEGGVFKSTDGGTTWSAIDDTLPARSIAMLAFDPVTPGTIYIAAFPEYDRDWNRLADGGIFKSTDGGTTWTSGVQLNAGGVGKLVVDPLDPATLYAVTYPLGLFRSTDGGATWSARGPLHDDIRAVTAFLIDPQTPTTLYLATDVGIFKSVDAGATWNAINAGITQLDVREVGVTSGETPTVYVGTARKGMFTSTDRGTSWSPANDGFGPLVGYWGISIEALAVDPWTPSTALAVVNGGNPSGPFQTTDGGSSWTVYPFDPFGRSMFCVTTIAVDPLDPRVVYAGRSLGGVCEGGVLRSVDGGPWTLTGAPAIRVASLAVDPIAPGTLYIGGDNHGGFYVSTDGGVSWTESTGLHLATVTAIAVDPLHRGVVHAATDEGIRTSTDGGRHWNPPALGLSESPVIVIDPRDSDVLYAGVFGVWRSADRGATWTALDEGLVHRDVQALALDPENPSELYAGTAGSGAFRIDLGAACRADAECDDGNACTADACEVSATTGVQRCVQRPLRGLDGVSCGFDVSLAAGPCASEKMRARFERLLARGHARLERAAARDVPARTVRALRAASSVADRALGLADIASQRGRISLACRMTLLDAFQEAESRALRHAHRLGAH